MQAPLPPPIATSEPGSYARHVVVDRMPRFIDQVIETNNADRTAASALRALGREIRDGVVRSPLADERLPPSGLEKEERKTWEEQIAANAGKKWLEIPWYFAESFFYLKLLVAFGYYAGVSSLPRDPFLPQKERELLEPNGGLSMARRVLASARPMDDDDAVGFFLHSALWGNRLDLSSFEASDSLRENVLIRGNDSLLVDHTHNAVSALKGARRIQVILDNAGPELACDLLLADKLLSDGREAGARSSAAAAAARSIVLHAKKEPFYVSDATVRDVLWTIDALARDSDPGTAAAGARLEEALRTGRLAVQDHWFWNSALHFTAFPADLKKTLGGGDVLVVKGDANYRRMLEDRKWDTSLSLDELARYFPAPFIALRTMKSELVVDVPREKAGELSRIDPQWMVNGKRGIIRFCRAGA